MYFGHPEKIAQTLNGTTKMPVLLAFYVRRRDLRASKKRERS